MLLALAPLVALAAAAGPPSPPCALATLALPAMEGTAQRVVVGQPQPCPPGDRREDFAVTTDFGDGTVASTPFEQADPLWFIGGEHAYRRAGTYQLIGTVTALATGEAKLYRRTVTIPNAPLTARRSGRPSFRTGGRARRVVAAFDDGNRLATATDHRASVRWGDGTRSKASIAQAADGSFAVSAAHRYGSTAPRSITTTVTDDRGARLTVKVKPSVRR